jgi:nitrogen PTS system EIIA component
MQDNGLCWDRKLILRLPAQDTRSVFQTIASHFADMTGLDPKAILAGLLERETLGSTGFGAGFALPHTLVSNLASPTKVLVTLRSAIEFHAPDDEPVDIFLAVIWPLDQQDCFLPGLAKQCRLFRSKKLLSALRNARSETEVLILLSVLESEQDLLVH